MRGAPILPSLALVSLVLNACATTGTGTGTGEGGDPAVASFTDKECTDAASAARLGADVSPHLCLALNSLLASVTTNAAPSALPITYPIDPSQYASFNAVVAASLKVNPTGNFVEVTFAPNLDADKVRSLQPPYDPTPIQIWIQEVKASGGKICRADAPQNLIGLLLFAVGDRVVKWLSNRAKARKATKALQAADNYNVVVYVTKRDPNGPNGNRIPSLRFIPRSQALKCDNSF